jgi:hypothetical protein
MLSALLAKLGGRLIIEFVPKEDPMTQTLLAARRDVFPDYTLEGFRAAFGPEWAIRREVPVEDSARVLYLMDRRQAV